MYASQIHLPRRYSTPKYRNTTHGIYHKNLLQQEVRNSSSSSCWRRRKWCHWSSLQSTNAERYYLRISLHAVRRPTSFAYLKIFDGQLWKIYREACQKHGLLDTTLADASGTSFPVQRRNLFAVIVTMCALSEITKKLPSCSYMKSLHFA